MAKGFWGGEGLVVDRMAAFHLGLIVGWLERFPSARQFEGGNPKDSRCEDQFADAVWAQHSSQVACWFGASVIKGRGLDARSWMLKGINSILGLNSSILEIQ